MPFAACLRGLDGGADYRHPVTPYGSVPLCGRGFRYKVSVPARSSSSRHGARIPLRRGSQHRLTRS